MFVQVECYCCTSLLWLLHHLIHYGEDHGTCSCPGQVFVTSWCKMVASYFARLLYIHVRVPCCNPPFVILGCCQ